MARVFTSTTHLRVERAIYRLTGVNPDAEQSARSYAHQRGRLLPRQHRRADGRSCSARPRCRWTATCRASRSGCPSTPRSRSSPTPTGSPTPASRRWASPPRWPAWRCRTSCPPRSASPSRWPSSAGSSAPAAARSATSGSTCPRHDPRSCCRWRSSRRILLIAGGVVQNFADSTDVHARRAHARSSPAGRSPARRPSRSSATTAAASSTPTPPTRSRTPPRFTNLLEIFLILVLPVSLTRTLGTMLGNRAQGLAILGAMGVLWSVAAGRHHLGRGRRPLAGRPGRGRRDGGQGDALRRMGLRPVRGGHDRHLDGRGQRRPTTRSPPTGGGTVLVNMMLGEIVARRRRSRHLRHPRSWRSWRSSSPA